MGTNFGNYFQRDANLGDFYAGSFGINLSSYGFWNHEKNIGIFTNMGLLLPYKNPLATNTIGNDFNQVVSGEFLMGPAFRYHINEELKLYYGFGINLSVFNFFNKVSDDDKFWDQRLGIGIGGDVGLKYDIADKFYINIGTTLVYNFLNYRVAESTSDNWTTTRRDSAGWVNNFSMVGIRPYIAFGVNYFSETVKVQWGKPKMNN
jgi:hypothetical protein